MVFHHQTCTTSMLTHAAVAFADTHT